MTLSAKIGYCVTRPHSGGTHYLARVRIFNRLCGRQVPCGAWLGMGDSRAEAESDALRYMRESMAREELSAPDPVNIGKMSRMEFDNPTFWS